MNTEEWKEWRRLLFGSETLPLFERGWGSRWSPVSGGSNIPSGTGHKAFVTCSRTHSCSCWGGVLYLTISCMSQSQHLTFLANENEWFNGSEWNVHKVCKTYAYKEIYSVGLIQYTERHFPFQILKQAFLAQVHSLTGCQHAVCVKHLFNYTNRMHNIYSLHIFTVFLLHGLV